VVILFSTFLIFLLIGVPIFIALAVAAWAYVRFETFIPDFVVLHRMAGGVDSFPLLAVPFFILAGNLMNTAGITNRIYDFAVAAVGWLRGGLGHVNVVGSVIFAGMSGTAVADAGGLGTIEIKAMRDHDYTPEFAVGITAASSTIGPIIPPSLPMVIFGVVANVSIGQLFAAGLIPGLLMAGCLMGYTTWYAHRHGIGRDLRFAWRRLGTTFVNAIPALLTPVIIIGGMSSGVFTPTEAAIAACAWALFLGIIFYPLSSQLESVGVSPRKAMLVMTTLLLVSLARVPFGWTSAFAAVSHVFLLCMAVSVVLFVYFTYMLRVKAAAAPLNFRQFYRISLETIETTASVLVIVGASSLFGWVLTTTRVTEQIAAALLSVTTDPLLILLIINLFLLVVGCFMETIAAISILVPVFMPIITQVGIDPVQFGVVMVLNLMIGLLTPPVGMVLFVLSRVAKISFDRTVAAVAPFLIPLLFVLVLISVVPWFTLALPSLWYR
jgi:tripartite ATP-independent transporter DctM subunit